MGLSTIENESHFLFTCDLYSEERAKLISNLNKMPQSEEHSILNKIEISKDNLTTHLMPLLSPNVPATPSTTNLNIHSIDNITIYPNTPTCSFFQHRLSYVVNCVCTFFLRCFEKRQKFTEDYRKAIAHANTITFNVIERTPLNN